MSLCLPTIHIDMSLAHRTIGHWSNTVNSTTADADGFVSLFEAALERLPDLILIHDQDFILFANAACRRFLGATAREQLEGRPVQTVVHPDGFSAGAHRRKLVLESGHSFRALPLKLVTLDGETVHVEADAHPLAIDDRRAVLVVSRVAAG